MKMSQIISVPSAFQSLQRGMNPCSLMVSQCFARDSAILSPFCAPFFTGSVPTIQTQPLLSLAVAGSATRKDSRTRGLRQWQENPWSRPVETKTPCLAGCSRAPIALTHHGVSSTLRAGLPWVLRGLDNSVFRFRNRTFGLVLRGGR